MLLRPQVAQWRAAGKEPFAYSFQRTHMASQLQELHADLPAGEVRRGASGPRTYNDGVECFYGVIQWMGQGYSDGRAAVSSPQLEVLKPRLNRAPSHVTQLS